MFLTDTLPLRFRIRHSFKHYGDRGCRDFKYLNALSVGSGEGSRYTAGTLGCERHNSKKILSINTLYWIQSGTEITGRMTTSTLSLQSRNYFAKLQAHDYS